MKINVWRMMCLLNQSDKSKWESQQEPHLIGYKGGPALPSRCKLSSRVHTYI